MDGRCRIARLIGYDGGMRLTPAQMAVRLICGIKLPAYVPCSDEIYERIREGHDDLVRLTGKDFRYDLEAWHNYLKEAREGGYSYGRNIVLPKMMKTAMESAEWQQAVKRLSANNLN
jgi:hypothetical protein